MFWGIHCGTMSPTLQSFDGPHSKLDPSAFLAILFTDILHVRGNAYLVIAFFYSQVIHLDVETRYYFIII